MSHMKTAQNFKVALALLVSMVIALGSCHIVVLPENSSEVGVIDVNAHFKSMNAWCNNMTGILLNTIRQFGSARFNKTSQFPSTEITDMARLTKDHRDLSIYSILLSYANTTVNTTVGKQIQTCINNNEGRLTAFLAAMQLTKSYLNGTIPHPPKIITNTTSRQSYKDISPHMAALMAHFRKLTEMFGKYFAASVIVR